MLQLATFLSKNGYNVKIWNIPWLFLQGFSEEEVLRQLSPSDSTIVFGLELNWLHQSKGAIQVAEKLKHRYPHIPIIIGGIHASLFAKEIIAKYSHCVDGILKGEAELSFLDYVRKLESEKPIDNVSGLVLKTRNGNILENSINNIIEDIDKLPPYSLRNIMGNIGPVIPIINICRGPCPLKCIHCVGSKINWRKKIVFHSPNWIVDQISILLDEGFSQIGFLEDQCVFFPKILYEIMRILIKEKIAEKLEHIDLAAIPGFLDKDILETLSRAGVTNIGYDIETGSQKILNLIGKNISISQIKDSIKITISKGIIPLTYWKFGFPEETREDIWNTAYLIKDTIELGGIPREVNPLLVAPGTELYDNAERYNIKLRMKSFEDYMIYSEEPINSYYWYPKLITHETKYLKIYDMLEVNLLLRKLIYKNLEQILVKIEEKINIINKYHPHLTLEDIVNRFINIPKHYKFYI